MLPEIELFVRWLRRKSPRSSTAVHYASDLKLFFAWLKKPCSAVTVQDIDAFIEHFHGGEYLVVTATKACKELFCVRTRCFGIRELMRDYA